MFTFSIFDQKHRFRENLDPKFKIICLKWSLVSRIIWICRLHWMVVFTFSVFDKKYSFWVTLVPKFKIVCLKWNLVPRLVWICRIHWWCLLSQFSTGILFFDKFEPKNQNCLFKLKFGTKTDSNIHNLMGMLYFSTFDKKYPFLGNLLEKNQNCWGWNLEPRINRICTIRWWFSFF